MLGVTGTDSLPRHLSPLFSIRRMLTCLKKNAAATQLYVIRSAALEVPGLLSSLSSGDHAKQELTGVLKVGD